MTHARGRQQLQDRIEHAEAGSQDRHDHDIAGHPASFSFFQRRLHHGALGRQIAQCLCDKQHTDAIGDLPEMFRLRVHVAQLAERVLDQRMWHEVH